ncbi:MAG: sulfoxide reductase heme-binding subunit YedZ [Hyphomicrobiales bacterium]|nr:sulfoxide reductase heme-binding subunit YedZ [Hyphomicrobiales bacterium]
MPPWTDRKGQLAPFKLVVFVALFLPAIWVAWQGWQGDLAPKPVNEAIHQIGSWTVRLLLVSLAVTPLRSIVRWPRLVDVRRMLGVGAVAYAVLHFFLYIADQGWDLWRVASEIVLRFYLTIGFVALLGLVALGVTSTDGMVRRLGALRWNRLHRTVYLLTVLSLVHSFLQAKVDVTEPVLMTGLFLVLMGHRALHKRGYRGLLPLAGLAIACGVLTALVEAGWYAARTGVDASRVLAANLSIDIAIRPSLWVLMIALALVPLRLIGEKRAPVRAQPVGRTSRA